MKFWKISASRTSGILPDSPDARSHMSRHSDRSIQYRSWGGPDSLEYGKSPPPGRPGWGGIQVRVHAISVNPVDWKILAGEQIAGVRLMHLLSRRRSPLFPRVFGSDFSGEVLESRSPEFKPGDRVAGMLSPISGGSGSTRINVRAAHCISLPVGFSWEQGASLPAAGISALAVCRSFPPRSRGKVLLIGAAGGVGSIALQILADRGYEVHAVGREHQAQLLKELGAFNVVPRNHWLDYARQEGPWPGIVDAPGALIRGRGENGPEMLLERRVSGSVYYPVYIPNDYIARQLMRILKWSFRSDRIRSGIMLAYPSAKRMMELQRNINNGTIRPVVDSSWSLQEFPPSRAVQHALNGGLSGKVIIRLDG